MNEKVDCVNQKEKKTALFQWLFIKELDHEQGKSKKESRKITERKTSGKARQAQE